MGEAIVQLFLCEHPVQKGIIGSQLAEAVNAFYIYADAEARFLVIFLVHGPLLVLSGIQYWCFLGCILFHQRSGINTPVALRTGKYSGCVGTSTLLLSVKY